VNNAGLPGQRNGIADFDLDRFDRLMAVNLRGPLLAIKCAAPSMIARQHGCVINIASVSGLRGGYSGHDYSVAKAGLLHLTRSVAVELGQHNIRVNSISPGPIATGIFARATGGGDRERSAEPEHAPFAQFLPAHQPMPRVGVTRDVAKVAVFLASDAAGFVNGQDIAVDGGMSAGRPWSVFVAERETMAADG